MIGKIAYAMAVAEDRVGYGDKLPIVRSILGWEDDMGRWVGNIDEPIEKDRRGITPHSPAGAARDPGNSRSRAALRQFGDSFVPRGIAAGTTDVPTKSPTVDDLD